MKKAHCVGRENISLLSNLSKNISLNNKGERAAHSSHGHAWVWLWHEWHIQVRPHPLGQTPENQYNPKMSPKPIQACHSFPNIALFQTHTRTKSNERNKSNWTNPQKELSPNSIDSTRVQLCSTKRYASMLLDVFVSAMILSLLEFCLKSKRMVKTDLGEQGLSFKGTVQSECLVVLFSPWGSGQPMDREL